MAKKIKKKKQKKTVEKVKETVKTAKKTAKNTAKVSETVSKKVRGSRDPVEITYTTSVKDIAEKANISAGKAYEICELFGQQIVRGLVEQGSFRFGNFGVWRVQTLPARDAMNPHTQEKIKIGERQKIRFVAGSKLIRPICAEYEGDSVEDIPDSFEPDGENEDMGDSEDTGVTDAEPDNDVDILDPTDSEDPVEGKTSKTDASAAVNSPKPTDDLDVGDDFDLDEESPATPASSADDEFDI